MKFVIIFKTILINFFYKTPAQHCIEDGNYESLRFLLEKGCNKKALIHSSIVFNRKRCLEILLEYHADPNEFDAEGSTPLFLCLKHNLLEFAIILIHKGADPSILVNNILII